MLVVSFVPLRNPRAWHASFCSLLATVLSVSAGTLVPAANIEEGGVRHILRNAGLALGHPGQSRPPIIRKPDGTVGMIVVGERVRDVSCLVGIPISELTLTAPELQDLTPLAALPLRVLSLECSPQADLGPLAGKPIKELDIRNTPFPDLRALRGMPLQTMWFCPRDVAQGIDAVTASEQLEMVYVCHSESPLPSQAWTATAFRQKLEVWDFGRDSRDCVGWRDVLMWAPLLVSASANPPQHADHAAAWDLTVINPDHNPGHARLFLGSSADGGHILADMERRPLTDSQTYEFREVMRKSRFFELDCLYSNRAHGSFVREVSARTGAYQKTVVLTGYPSLEAPPEELDGVLRFLCVWQSLTAAVSVPSEGVSFAEADEAWSKSARHELHRDLTASQVRAILKGAGIPVRNPAFPDHPVVTRRFDGTFRVMVGDEQLRDVSALAQIPISELFLSSRQLQYLAPLAALPLRVLSLECSPQADLGPLAGKPIEELDIRNTPFPDLRALRGMPLRTIWFCPRDVTLGLDAVTGSENLEMVYVYHSDPSFPGQTWTATTFRQKVDIWEFKRDSVGTPPEGVVSSEPLRISMWVSPGLSMSPLWDLTVEAANGLAGKAIILVTGAEDGQDKGGRTQQRLSPEVVRGIRKSIVGNGFLELERKCGRDAVDAASCEMSVQVGSFQKTVTLFHVPSDASLAEKQAAQSFCEVWRSVIDSVELPDAVEGGRSGEPRVER